MQKVAMSKWELCWDLSENRYSKFIKFVKWFIKQKMYKIYMI